VTLNDLERRNDRGRALSRLVPCVTLAQINDTSNRPRIKTVDEDVLILDASTALISPADNTVSEKNVLTWC